MCALIVYEEGFLVEPVYRDGWIEFNPLLADMDNYESFYKLKEKIGKEFKSTLPYPENEPLIIPESASVESCVKTGATSITSVTIYLTFQTPLPGGSHIGVRWSTVSRFGKLWFDVFEQEVVTWNGHVRINVTPFKQGGSLPFCLGDRSIDGVQVSFAVFQVQPDGTRKWNNNNGQNYNLLIKDD